MRESARSAAVLLQSCPILCDPMDCNPRTRNSPGKNTGVDSHFLLQGIFLAQGLKPGSPALQADSLLPEPPGKVRNSDVNFDTNV